MTRIATAIPVRPMLIYRNSPLMFDAVGPFVISCKGNWIKNPSKAIIIDINQIFQDILTSDIIDQIIKSSISNSDD